MRIKIWKVGIILVFISVSFAQAQTEGLILYLPFDEASGIIARDMSGYGNDGEILGARRVQGKNGSGLAFNGVSSYVEVPYDKMFNLIEAVTLAAWVKPAQLKKWRCIINGRKSEFGPYLLQMRGDKGEIGVMIDNGCLWTWAGTITALDTKNFWHLVGTYDTAKGFNLHVNGKSEFQSTHRGPIDTNVDEGITIGHNYGMGGRWFEGIIDEVAIFNRALTDDEVMDLYEGRIKVQFAAVSPTDNLTTTWACIKVQ